MANLKVRFTQRAVVLERYPFLRRNTGRAIPAGDIREVVMNWYPQAVRTADGEFLFVPAFQEDELLAFASQHGIRCIARTDIWSLILEPFLDTGFNDKDRMRTSRILAENGVDEIETTRIRRLVGSPMLAWTLISWEWEYYGLFDALCQMRALGWLKLRRFERFYDQAMDLANRGNVSPWEPPVEKLDPRRLPS